MESLLGTDSSSSFNLLLLLLSFECEIEILSLTSFINKFSTWFFIGALNYRWAITSSYSFLFAESADFVWSHIF